MSKKIDLLERKVERIESYLMHMATSVNINLPAARIPDLESSSIFDEYNPSIGKQDEFFWGVGDDVITVNHDDRVFLNELFQAFPDVLSKETRSNMSSEEDIDIGLVAAFLRDSKVLNDNHHVDQKYLYKISDSIIQGRVGCHSRKGLVKLNLDGSIVEYPMSLQDIPLVFIKYGILAVQHGGLLPDGGCRLMMVSDFDKWMKYIFEYGESIVRRLPTTAVSNVNTTVETNDIKFTIVSINNAVTVMANHVDISLTMNFTSDGVLKSTRIQIKGGLEITCAQAGHGYLISKAYNQIMSDKFTYKQASRVFTFIANVKHRLQTTQTQDDLVKGYKDIAAEVE